MIRYGKLLIMLETISKKEMAGIPLTEDEYRTIWNIGAMLKSVTELPHPILSRIAAGTDEKMAMIADVHTDPNSGQVLEEAVGFPYIIVVMASVKGKNRIVQGPVFSYYEFKQSMSNRLTDEQWQIMLGERLEPSPPKWAREFIYDKK